MCKCRWSSAEAGRSGRKILLGQIPQIALRFRHAIGHMGPIRPMKPRQHSEYLTTILVTKHTQPPRR